jgi:hypothetical protein
MKQVPINIKVKFAGETFRTKKDRSGMKFALSAGIAFCGHTVILSIGAIGAFCLASFMQPVKIGSGWSNPCAFACRLIGLVMFLLALVSFFYAVWGLLAGSWRAVWDEYVDQCRRLDERNTGIR